MLESRALAFGFSVGKPESGPAKPRRPHQSKLAEARKVSHGVQREGNRLLLARYVPLAGAHQRQTSGDSADSWTYRFCLSELHQERRKSHLLKMARPGLLFELQSAIDEARKQGFEAIRPGVRVEDEKINAVTIRAGSSFKLGSHTTVTVSHHF